MSEDEIFARIAYDVSDAVNSTFGMRDVTVWMTTDLFRKLRPETILYVNEDFTTIFGCKLKVVMGSGLWWIVGYEGNAEEAPS